jgi:xylulokinase
MSELLLGIDIGTASSKGVVARPDGEVVATATREHAVSLPRPGWVEHDAESVWWDGVVALARRLTAEVDGRIAAVGISGIGPCVAPCDSSGRPLRPAILYGVDTRASGEVEEMTAALGEDAILRRCGSALSSQALGPKLAWLKRNEPDVWRSMARWHMASSFAVARLTGEWVLDHHSASQCDPFYDLAQSDWARDWVDAFLPDLPLPALAWPAEIAGEVHANGAAMTGIPAGTPVIAGTIDCWAEAASVGVRRPGELMLQYGSTCFLVLGVERPAGHESLWTTRGLDPGSLTIAAGLATAGSLAEWVRHLVAVERVQELVDEAAAVAPGADGLLVLPYFAGERTPILDPRARGTITGLSLRHGRAELYRATLEGVAYGIRHNLEIMGTGAERVVAVGGGTQSRLWPQIVSDVTGVPQEIPDVTMGACYGDALLAGEGAGLVPAGTAWVRPKDVVEPSAATADVYAVLYDLYRDLYPATRPIQHALAALQERGTSDGGVAVEPDVASIPTKVASGA